MGHAPEPAAKPEEAWALWATIKRNAEKLGRHDFGNPEVFFKLQDPLSTWVTFTVTTTDPWFLERLAALSGVATRRQGLVSLVDSPWLITVAPCPKPHFLGQPDNVWTWWGFSLCHDKNGSADQIGDHVRKKITECSGSEILEETIEQFGFGSEKARILGSSVCIPCLLPHAGSVWLKRKEADRPKVIPGWSGELRLHRPVLRNAERHNVYHGIFGSFGARSGCGPVQAQSESARRLSGPERPARARRRSGAIWS